MTVVEVVGGVLLVIFTCYWKTSDLIYVLSGKLYFLPGKRLVNITVASVKHE